VNAGRLKAFPVFATLRRHELRRIAACCLPIDVVPGDELLRQGKFAFEFFAIESGTAEVLRDGERVAELGAGDVFGELGALSHGQRNASVFATEPGTVIYIRAQDFRHFADEMPELGKQIRRLVEERSSSY
jgi:CRP/FNR family transcriptional regulator, cyclic AMP receptor protein